MGEAIKTALNDKLIDEEYFFTDDGVLLAKLKKSKNEKVLQLLDRLTVGKDFVYDYENTAEFVGPNKARYADPLVENNGRFERVSDLVESLKYSFEEFSKRYKNIGVRQLL